MPVTRIKARPKKENKLSIEFTEKEFDVLYEVLKELLFQYEYLNRRDHLIRSMLKKFSDACEGV